MYCLKHTKANHIQHEFLRIQNYLKSTGVQITKEERQLIFKMRWRVTDLKMNFKRKYEDHNCEACKQEEETQKHILECKEIQKKQPNIRYNPEYEKLFHGNLNDKIEIAKTFKENMDIRESIRKVGLWQFNNLLVPSDRILSVSVVFCYTKLEIHHHHHCKSWWGSWKQTQCRKAPRFPESSWL